MSLKQVLGHVNATESPTRAKTPIRLAGDSVGYAFALAGDRLAVGTAVEIWEFHNAPAVARRLEPANKHDTRFLPRSSHTTGDIQIHEMLWASYD